jgi:ribosomal protein L15E
MEELTKEEIVAMAIAAIAEESGTDAKNLRVVSFREIGESALDKYVRENNIAYRKYQLEDELV